MSNLIQTKERLNSTKSTQKVIKAMELVASSKIKKAKEKALNNKDYFQQVTGIMQSIYSFEDMFSYMNLDECEDSTLIIGITSDMGLCGAYNNNVIKKVTQLIAENDNPFVVMAGNKGVNKFNFEGISMHKAISEISRIEDFSLAKDLAEEIINLYSSKRVNKVLVVYTKFVNPIVQQVEVIDLFSLEQIEKDSLYNHDLEVDGDKKQIFNSLFIQYIYSVSYYAVLNSIASEYASRRNSMDAANNNSLELIEHLNLEMNRIRQAMITQEIAEIIGGAEALNKE